jgi:hypothetical protein
VERGHPHQVVPANLGHPAGAGHVGIVCPMRPVRLARGIDAQHDPAHLFPGPGHRAGSLRVEQAQVGDEERLAGQHDPGGRFIEPAQLGAGNQVEWFLSPSLTK